MSGPTKAEAPELAGCGGFEDQSSTDSGDSEAHTGRVQATNAKQLATLQARFALTGYALTRLTDGSLMLSRWGYTRALDDLNQAAQVLALIGGRHG